MKQIATILIVLLSLNAVFTSCVDAKIEEAVEYSDFYANVDDADAAILGLYGQFQNLAAQTIVLNELRGDLLDVTQNAPADLKEINARTPSAGNEWTNIKNYYKVIQSANDILYNLKIMYAANKLTKDQYNERYSDVGALRSWVYYQLGIQFNKIPYITEPIVDYQDLLKYKDNELTLDELIPTLIEFMKSLPTLQDYVNSKLAGSSTVDGYSLSPFFINKKCFLGDLYLFNNQYEEAASIYREVLSYGEDLSVSSRDQYRKNRIYSTVWIPSDGEVDFFSILYHRYKPDDVTTLYNAWKGMFSLPADNTGVLEEMIWEISYDYRYSPTYPFIEMFSTEGKGKYYLKPSTYAVQELWGTEIQKNGFPYDSRGVGGGIRKVSDGVYAVNKYDLNYNPQTNVYDQSGKWYIYRAATLHLRYAEAANRAGYPRLAWALVNDGIAGSAFAWKKSDGTSYRADSINQSSYGPGNNYPAPFYFDGRSADAPYLRGPYRSNAGIRGRANLPNVALSAVTKADSIIEIENMIVKEAALETAFEGNRWTDLLRVARRRQKENGSGTAFLQNHLKRKYEIAGQDTPDYSSEEKWYLNFNQ